MPEGLKLGDKVVLMKTIWDDGQDRHPPYQLGQAGDIVIVQEVEVEDEYVGVIQPSAPGLTFYLSLNEFMKYRE